MTTDRERRVLCRGNRTVISIAQDDSGEFVEKRLLDFANVSPQRTALYYEALIQKAAFSPGVVPILDERLAHVDRLHEIGEVPQEFDSFRRHYVRGYSLRELTSETLVHLLTPERCLVWVARVAQVLHRVHSLPSIDNAPLGLVHRDVTWDNILVAEDELTGSPQGSGIFLNDFGLAHVQAWGPLPLEETLQGAPYFLCPELKAGGQPSAAGDVYQAALTLCFLLHASERRSPQDLFKKGFSNPVSDLARELLRPFGAESCLEERPARRPTALELADLLSR